MGPVDWFGLSVLLMLVLVVPAYQKWFEHRARLKATSTNEV